MLKNIFFAGNMHNESCGQHSPFTDRSRREIPGFLFNSFERFLVSVCDDGDHDGGIQSNRNCANAESCSPKMTLIRQIRRSINWFFEHVLRFSHIFVLQNGARKKRWFKSVFAGGMCTLVWPFPRRIWIFLWRMFEKGVQYTSILCQLTEIRRKKAQKIMRAKVPFPRACV